jgi:hypothetical protein
VLIVKDTSSGGYYHYRVVKARSTKELYFNEVTLYCFLRAVLLPTRILETARNSVFDCENSFGIVA